jgi:hypothetical protein
VLAVTGIFLSVGSAALLEGVESVMLTR